MLIAYRSSVDLIWRATCIVYNQRYIYATFIPESKDKQFLIQQQCTDYVMTGS